MRYSLTMAFACGILFLACSDSNKVSGTATDTENMLTAAVTGTVSRSDGSLAIDAAVRMSKVYSGESLALPEFVEVKTDTAGVFAFDSAIADTFQLAVIDEDADEISYMPRVSVGSKDVEKIKLSKAAHFNSMLYYEDLDDPQVAVGSHFTVYMPGMPFTQSVFAGDSFSMMIPAGTWWFGFCPGDPQIIAKLRDSGVADSLIYRVWDMDSLKVSEGDSLDVGPFLWSVSTDVDSLMKEEPEDLRRISGSIDCGAGYSCAGVEVMAVLDIYGFGFVGDSSVFTAQTETDSVGRWWLPAPDSVPYDSFRVEYRLGDSVKTKMMGLSRYVKASEIRDLDDTLDLGKAGLVPQSGLISNIALVIDKRDSTQSNNCMVNSVVVGAKGTAHFVRAVTCNSLRIKEMPSGEQELVLYSGDTKVISTLQEADTPIEEYVVSTFVNLPKGDDLEWQGMTYTPPTLPKTEKK